jgi:hypothetical protein
MAPRHVPQVVIDAQEARMLPENLDVVVQRPEIPALE